MCLERWGIYGEEIKILGGGEALSEFILLYFFWSLMKTKQVTGRITLLQQTFNNDLNDTHFFTKISRKEIKGNPLGLQNCIWGIPNVLVGKPNEAWLPSVNGSKSINRLCHISSLYMIRKLPITWYGESCLSLVYILRNGSLRGSRFATRKNCGWLVVVVSAVWFTYKIEVWVHLYSCTWRSIILLSVHEKKMFGHWYLSQVCFIITKKKV